MLSTQHLIIIFILGMIGQAERMSMKYGMRVDERCIVTVLPLSLIVTLNSRAAVSKRSRAVWNCVKSKECTFGSYRARRYERHQACFTAQLNTI